MAQEPVAEEYVRLALAIDQHDPGYVDAYFGPHAWKEQSQADGKRPLSELTERAFALGAALVDGGAMDSQRRDYLSRQVRAMHTRLRVLQGEHLPFLDEVELLFDVRPTWVDEAVIGEAQRQLDELLPPGDTLFERMTLHKQSLEISVQQARDLLPAIVQRLRDLTRRNFPLPNDESLDFAFVQDKPWQAYNSYLGNGRSHIEICTDLPPRLNWLVSVVSHEAYPGHHTELAIKDSRLVQQAGWLEHSVALIISPSCVVAEGIATCALSAVMPADAWVAWFASELFPRAGLNGMDAGRAYSIESAWNNLDAASSNAALLMHDRGAAVDEVIKYLQRYELLTEPEARQRIEFMGAESNRAYIFTYYWGRRMVNDLLASKQDAALWYGRLLTEAVTPTQIRQWTAE